MQTEIILYIILAGILALSLALFQYIYRSKKRDKLSWSLTFLRFTTLFSVLLLLINPKFNKTSYYTEKPNLIVAIDNSESVGFLEQTDNSNNFVALLKSNEALNDRFDIEYYKFGKDVGVLDQLSFNEKQTNPTVLFDRFSQVYGNSIAPLLMVTDGNQTYGNDYEFGFQKFKQPVFPIILGDTINYIDLKIEQLNVNKYAYSKNKFPVEIIVNYNGNEDVTSQLILTSGNSTVYSQSVKFSKEATSRIITLTLPANTPGVHSYKATLKPISNEKNTINNVKNFAVEVIDRKTSVAIVSDLLHPDMGALKKAIESNEQRLATILSPSEFLNHTVDFQQVILYQPNDKFKSVYKALETMQINIFTILGTKTKWSDLNDLQNDFKQSITNQFEDYQSELNLNYNSFIVEDLGFSDFPPLSTEFGPLKFSVPIDVILYKKVNGIQLKEPLLLTYEVGQKRAVVMNGEGIWRWRAQSYLNDKSFNGFDNFIGKIIQYLDSEQRKSRLNMSYDSFYDGNDNVVMTAQFFNKNYEFDTSETLEITVTNKDNKQSQTLPFILKQNNYQVDLSGLPAADYQFTVRSKNENISKSGEFKILDYNVEQQFLNANVSKLKGLATKSQGTAHFIKDSEEIVAQLLKDERFATIQKSTKNVVPLIDWKFLLALIALSLSLEWFIRKYNGLI
ncbi:hypothetical protein BXY82_2070 [Gelidibacter sediminis]|uniref:VWA domain-containing protein n=1 Tax=Gelidibacter sediminis TaxID=1608710 RepID=A0A4R7Q0P1_9FLAO|nr:VWA domain-containing protein [Gelidibacter sediminis]TDU40031.1 hypothetical protein BXY82_2070 [Gelidibacter sediminis]